MRVFLKCEWRLAHITKYLPSLATLKESTHLKGFHFIFKCYSKSCKNCLVIVLYFYPYNTTDVTSTPPPFPLTRQHTSHPGLRHAAVFTHNALCTRGPTCRPYRHPYDLQPQSAQIMYDSSSTPVRATSRESQIKKWTFDCNLPHSPRPVGIRSVLFRRSPGILTRPLPILSAGRGSRTPLP